MRERLRVEGDAVHLDEGVYASVPTRRARVALLVHARSLARSEIVLHVIVQGAGTHRGRLVRDLPRRALRALRIPSAREPGDRTTRGGFVHLFFDEEPLRREIAEAGLVVAARRGDAWVLVPGEAAPERPASFAEELARVAAVVVEVERRRRRDAPERVVREMRARGAIERERGPVGRARLVRAIGWIDAALPGGQNCYRRTLLELALDAGAARETLVFGLDVGRTGHVAFKGREDGTMERFDVVYELGPD